MKQITKKTRMEFIKAHPKLSTSIGIITLLGLNVFTMYLARPIITWALISVAIGLGYMIFRPYVPITKPYDERYTDNNGLRKVRTVTPDLHKNRNRHLRGWLVFALLIYILIVCIFTINGNMINNYMYKVRAREYSEMRTGYNYPNIQRISCNQTVRFNKIDTIIDTGYVTRHYSLFSPTFEVKNLLYSYTKSSVTFNDTLIDTLRIDGITCGDTVTAIKRKPYWDRNFSLIRTNKKFISSDWELVDTTYYTNKSPHIGEWELRNIFNDTRAEYRYDRYINKYVVKLIDESKSDTLDSKDDAVGLLNAKCKDKATVAGKLIYAEYDACKSNNTVERIKISERTICGYAKVLLEYDRGAVAGTPDNCMYKSNYGWTYE